MTPKTLNRYNSKCPEVKICFVLDLFLTKCFRIISCERFLFKKCSSRQFFNKKRRASSCFGGNFVYSSRLVVIYDSQATNRSVAVGGGLSQGVLPASY
jgi:hypothetical protein